jgi:DNA-directed RNA polymerase subunit RPC12/RpoP
MQRIHDHEREVTYFGQVDHRGAGTKFGIKTDDRRRHMYVLGKTGVGKTTLLENMLLQDIYRGHGVCYVDPHGDTVERMLDFIPAWRMKDVVYFNPADLDFPIGFNVLERVSEKQKHLVASGLMGVFQKIWANMWSARMEYLLNNAILALMEYPGATLLGINRLFSDEAYRSRVLENVRDPIVKQFWVMEYASYSEKFASEAVAAVQNKVGQFLSASIIRNIVAQETSTIDIRSIMDNHGILLVNLSKGRIGEDNSRLLGGMLISKIQIAAMERVDTPERDRKDFYLYVDEFQNFATESFATILSEARKYRLNLIVAHQYIAQLKEEVCDAVLGNVGSILSFRIGGPDAEVLEKEFMPRFTVEDLINLPKYHLYLKLMIDGVASEPFSAQTLPPIGATRTGSEAEVIAMSRERYGRDREAIEQGVREWSGVDAMVNVVELMEDARIRAKGMTPKKRYKYKCSHCAKELTLNTSLDRARPVYCDDCRPIITELKRSKQYDPRQELIYNEALEVVGSVAELGDDGSWLGKKKIAEERGEAAPRLDVHEGEMVEAEVSGEPLTLAALESIDASAKKKRKRKRKRKGKAQREQEHAVKTNTNGNDEGAPAASSTPLRPGELVQFSLDDEEV